MTDSPDIEAVIRLPGSVTPEQLDFVREQLGRVAEAIHEGKLCAVVPIPSDLTPRDVEAYSMALTAFNDDWWSH